MEKRPKYLCELTTVKGASHYGGHMCKRARVKGSGNGGKMFPYATVSPGVCELAPGDSLVSIFLYTFVGGTLSAGQP